MLEGLTQTVLAIRKGHFVLHFKAVSVLWLTEETYRERMISVLRKKTHFLLNLPPNRSLILCTSYWLQGRKSTLIINPIKWASCQHEDLISQLQQRILFIYFILFFFKILFLSLNFNDIIFSCKICFWNKGFSFMICFNSESLWRSITLLFIWSL